MLFKNLLLAGAALALAAPATHATVRLPALVGSHMVLQRGQPLVLWGWAAPGEAVSLTFRGKTYAATAPDAEGRWQATLPPAPAGGPFALTVKGQNTIELTDVLVGDVWLAAGQSNMQYKVKDTPGGYQPVLNADQEVAAANWPGIRFFTVTQTAAYQAQADVAGSGWQVCSPATVAQFSAVAYFFSRDLYQQYKVPQGVVVSSWGGTPAEAWTSAEGLKNFPEFAAQLTDFAQRPTSLPAYDARQRDLLQHSRDDDKGYLPGGSTWATPAIDTHAWPTRLLPGHWEATPALRTYGGVVWFRREIDLPAALAGQPLMLRLGKIDAADSTWFNGVRVGSGSGSDQPRAYAVPAALVQPGRNVIAVRVVDTGGRGGIAGEPAELALTAGSYTLPLAGPWHYQVGLAPPAPPSAPVPGGAQVGAATLYNGMVAPLLPLALKGVIWYQGETNVDRAEQYRSLFPALITDWRQHWGRPLPFLFVQLAGFQPEQPQPTESALAELREAQAQALQLPATGMATAIDLGDPADIHPHNKQDVGHRLALAARHVAYAEAHVPASGPTFAGWAVRGPVAQITFTGLGGGLRSPEGVPLRGFAVAGADRRFYWASARLVGRAVEVQSPQVPHPVAVRYDWADSPDGNLYNTAGLPAVPFRTDTWPGLTAGRK